MTQHEMACLLANEMQKYGYSLRGHDLMDYMTMCGLELKEGNAASTAHEEALHHLYGRQAETLKEGQT